MFDWWEVFAYALCVGLREVFHPVLCVWLYADLFMHATILARLFFIVEEGLVTIVLYEGDSSVAPGTSNQVHHTSLFDRSLPAWKFVWYCIMLRTNHLHVPNSKCLCPFWQASVPSFVQNVLLVNPYLVFFVQNALNSFLFFRVISNSPVPLLCFAAALMADLYICIAQWFLNVTHVLFCSFVLQVFVAEYVGHLLGQAYPHLQE